MGNQNVLYFATDGDEIGKRHAAALLDDNIEEISRISESITAANEMVQEFFEARGGRKISLGGDEGVFEAPAEAVNDLEQLRKDYEYMIGSTLSIGYGSRPSEAGKALLEAKETGKNKVVQYSDNSEKHSQKIQEERDQESGDSPEQKAILAVTDPIEPSDQVLPEGTDSEENEPTLSEPPKKDNNHGYDSGYKNSEPEARQESYEANDEPRPVIEKPNLKAKPRLPEAVSADYPECDRVMNEEPANPGEEGPMIPKPDPKGYHGQAEGEAPESEAQPREDRPSDLKYLPGDGEQIEPQADMPIEDATSDLAEETEAEDMGADRHCPSCTCDEHGEDIESILDQHLDNAKDFADSIGSGPEDSVEEVLDQHAENHKDMIDGMDSDGVSHPADYDDKQQDMGLSEDEAEEDSSLLNVMNDGLDQHADDIQKEKVINMIGEALEGFKSQKAILDKAKDQAPELYSSCISLLRALIELCSLAGIDGGEAEQEVNEIEGGAVPEEQPGAEQEFPQEEAPQEVPADDSCPNCGHSDKENEQPAVPKEGPFGAPQQ